MVWNSLTAEELRKNFKDRIPDLIGPVQVLVSVPKKKRRKAVDRVLMRRRIREAFRRNRGQVLVAVDGLPNVRTLSIGLVYMKEANVGYREIETKMLRLFDRLAERLKEKYDETIADESSDNAD